MADGRYKAVMLVNADVKGAGAHGFRQGGYLGDGLLSSVGTGNDAVGLVPEQVRVGVLRTGCFFAGHGMATHEVNSLGKILVCPLQHHFFGAAYVGDQAALGKLWTDDFHELLHRHNRSGQYNDVGIPHHRHEPAFNPVEGPRLLSAAAGAAAGVGSHHLHVFQLGFFQCQGQGGSNKSGADNA